MNVIADRLASTCAQGRRRFHLVDELSGIASMSYQIYANYDIDPRRLSNTIEQFRRRNLSLLQQGPDDYVAGVKWLITKTRPINLAMVNRFPDLQRVVVLGTEAWMVDLPGETNIRVSTIAENRGYEVAEHAVALLLAAIKKLRNCSVLKSFEIKGLLKSIFFSEAAEEVSSAHNWTKIETSTLYGKKIGIVGFGLIGREIHRRLSGFGSKIIYFNRERYSSAIEKRLKMEYADLKEIFATCDAVFLQLPLTNSTRGMIGRDILSQCRPGLVLINCGRAAVADEESVYQGLKNGRLGFYATDVFWREPINIFNRFLRLKNCLVTPHMAESLPGREQNHLGMALDIICEDIRQEKETNNILSRME